MTPEQFFDYIDQTKYRRIGESFRESCNRLASALKDSDAHFREFREILLEQRFLPAGRVRASMGIVGKMVTPYNCFVSGTIEDSFTSGNGSIMQRAAEAAETMRMGGGIGYDFSTLRPRGSLIRKLQSHSSGPISFMEIYNAVCNAVSSSGHRRGAQMAVLRVDHPDIEEFVLCKRNQTAFRGFNISVAITNEFMDHLENQKPFPLRFGTQVYREIDPVALWETIMRSTWDWAEPGVLFIDTINNKNNLKYCEKIAATNPCGEQPLPPYGACLLGSFNLPKYLWKNGQGTYEFDYEQFELDIPPVVRAMDNIVDRANYPLYEQEKEAKAKRRMGLGVTGLANCLEAMNMPYGSPFFLEEEDHILQTLLEKSYRTSIFLAETKGAFELFNSRYCNSQFIEEKLPHFRDEIRRKGIRNSHLTSIAPTGTISLAAGNVSSGIEPVFQYIARRIVQTFDGPIEIVLPDYGWSKLGVQGKCHHEVTIDEHLEVLIKAASNVDSAVSKTCNVPSNIPWENFKELYKRAWREGCKGLTTFTTGGQREGILKEDFQPKADTACEFDPTSGRRSCE